MEPLGTEPEQPEEGEVQEPEWSGVSQEDWDRVSTTLEGLQPIIEYMQNPDAYREPPPQEDGAEPQLDPFSDNFADQLQSLIDSRLAPVSEFTEQAQLDEAEERAMDIIQDIVSREGEFLMPERSTKLARAMAEEFLPEAEQRYGFGPRAAEAALQQAVKTVREIEQEIGQTYYERKQNELGTLAGARREPPAAGTQGAQNVSTPEGGDERALVEAYFGRGTGR